MREGVVLTSLNGENIELLKTKPEQFWLGIKEIANGCFNDKDITHLTISEPVKVLGEKSFYGCSNLKNIVLPKSLKEIQNNAFYHCSELESIVIPDSVKSLGTNVFENCTNLKEIVLSNNLKKLGIDCFAYCYNLTSVVVPDSVKTIEQSCFYACNNLSYVSIPSRADISDSAFSKNKFKYYYKNKKEKRVYFAEKLPEDMTGITNVLDLEVCKQAFYSFDQNLIEFVNNENTEKIIDAAKTLNKLGMKLPYMLVRDMVIDGKFDEFIKNSHFTFFKKELSELLKQNMDIWSQNFKNDFFSFVISLGCFSKDKMLDKNGQPTNTYVYQKASTIVAQMYKLGAFSNTFDHMGPIRGCDMYVAPNQNFLNFLSFKEGKDKYTNLELMLEMNEVSTNIFDRIMPEFDKLAQFRTYLNDDGKPKLRPWKEAIEKFLAQSAYENVNSKNQDIAELFATKGLMQRYFDEASKLRKVAKFKDVPQHILGKELREDTIQESILKIKANIDEMLVDSKVLIDELYAKQFTYEMLDKYDAKNFVLGVYCSCCASINSPHYGSTITRASVTAENVQNMVVKNTQGAIVGKCTLYVNKKLGYIVINDFEINSKYKENELSDDDGIVAGRYTDAPDSKERKERDLIFDTFMRGIKAFVAEYDKQNPNNPIQQVNVGLGHNRLQEQCEAFEWTSDCLKVPANYEFSDAENMQVVLYKRQQQKENNNSSIKE